MPIPLKALLSLVFMPAIFLFVLGLNVIQTLSVVTLPLSPKLFRRINRICAQLWYGSLALTLEQVLRVKFVVTGDSLPKGENAFVIGNHQSMADIPAIVVLAFRCGRGGDIKWFVKDVIKWVPGIGWGMLFLDCLYVKRNWNADKEKVMRTFETLRSHRVPFWVLSFVEGTRLTPAKLKRAQDFERKAGLPVLSNVMSPRTKGFEATLEGLGPTAEAVYDVTIGFDGYPAGQVPGLLALFFGSIQRIHLHVRRYPYAQLPTTREARVQWVMDRFVEKDVRLKEFRERGTF